MSITETVFYCRNCLLCDNNVVKITDVAMGISLFNSDYSEVRGRSCAPIRWQPWETLLLVSLWILYSLESVKLICNKVAFVQNRQAFLYDKKEKMEHVNIAKAKCIYRWQKQKIQQSKSIICVSIDIYNARSISLYALSWPKLNFWYYLTFEIIF